MLSFFLNTNLRKFKMGGRVNEVALRVVRRGATMFIVLYYPKAFRRACIEKECEHSNLTLALYLVFRSPEVKSNKYNECMKKYFTYWKECYTKKYFKFYGRSSRQEFIGFTIFSIISYVLLLLTMELDGYLSINLRYISFTILLVFYPISIIPTLALINRRLHDMNISGAFLIVLLLIFGGIKEFVRRSSLDFIVWETVLVLLVFGLFWLVLLVCKGTNGHNHYGDL